MMKSSNRVFHKLLSLLLAVILVTSLVPGNVYAAGVNSLVESLNNDSWLENNAIHVDVSKNTGAFYIRTVTGDKLVKGDENANLLWPSEDDTSFTTVRITRGGVAKDYIFGKDYGSDSSVEVTNDGTQISAVWTVDSVTFTQTITLQPSNNDAHGMVVINYTAQNSGAAADIGIRVLLDTAMGGKDYAYYNIGDAANPVATERELGQHGYDKSIYMMDDPSDPLVTGYLLNGSVNGVEQEPVKTIIAHWANLASTVYDYTPDSGLNFTNAFNARHLTSDSAVALYYSLGSVSAGGSASTQLNYGLYSNEKVKGYSVAVNLQTVDALSFTDEKETAFKNDGKFTAKTILQNASGKTYDKVRIYAYASGGISVLDSNESPVNDAGKTYGYDNPYYVEINGFTPGQKVNNLSNWNFQAVMAAEANYGRIHFKAYDMSSNNSDDPLETDLIGEAKKYILVPGSVEKLPQIQLTGSSPSIFHTEGHRVFNVTGMKFAGLEAESGDKYSLKLSRKDGGMIRDNQSTLLLPEAAFTINQDGSGLMTVTIDGTLPEGEYKLTMDYTDPDREDIDAKALEFQVIDDARYKCETYGLVIVYRTETTAQDGSHPRQDYLVGTFADENMYNNWMQENHIDESDVLMIYRGVFDDLTNSLPEGASAALGAGEQYEAYLMATLSDDENDVVTMSNALKFSYYEPGSNIVIKQVKKTVSPDSSGDTEKNSVKVDFNCRITTAGVGTRVFTGVSCFTELKADNRYSLIEYDDAGERNDSADGTIALLWPRAGIAAQYLMGVLFDFRYAELGAMYDENGDIITRTVGFGAGLDLSCIIPGADELEGDTPGMGDADMDADEIRSWNEANDIRNQTKSFSEKNKDRAGGNLSNGFYDEEDGMTFSGSVQVSDILFGSNSFIGFNFCVGVGIPPLTYNMPSIEGVFTLRTIGQVEFRVNGSLDFVTMQMEGLLDLKANDAGILIPDELKFFIGGITPGYPLDPWGVLWLQGGGGGIKDLYDTIYLQDKVPPIKLILQAQVSLLQLLVAKGTVEAGLTGFGVALSDVRIQATDIPVLNSAVIALRWYPNFALIGSVDVDLLDVIEGGGYIVGYINYDGSNPFFEFFLRAALHLPGDIPVVGGMTLGSVSMGVSTERIFGRAEAMGIGIGFSYYWRNEFDWGSKNEANPTFPELLGLGQEFDTDIDEMFEDIPTGNESGSGGNDPNANAKLTGGLKDVPIYYDREHNRTLMASAGTNFDPANTVFLMEDENASGSSQQNTVKVTPDGKNVEITFGSNGKSKIVLLSWSSDSEADAQAQAAEISTGTYALTLLDHTRDAAEQTSANANLSYDENAKKASLAITVTDSSVKSLKIGSPRALDAVVYDVDALPELKNCTASLSGSDLTVNLAGTKLDTFDYVNVGLIKRSEWEAANADNSIIPEIILVDRINKDSVTGSLPSTDSAMLPADLPSGDYVVRLMAQDEAQTQVSQLDLSGNILSFTNQNTPSDPVSVGNITGAGDWKVNIPISAGTANDFDGYALTVIDSQGAPVSGLTDLLFYRNGETVVFGEDGLLTVPAENSDAGLLTIGGRFEVPVSNTTAEDGSMTANEATLTGTEIVGFDAGSYTVNVRKWKAAGGIPVYSGTITKDFTVSAPAPANVSINASTTVTRAEQRDNTTVNIPCFTDNALFTLNSDKAVTGSWTLDGQPAGDVAGQMVATLDLQNARLSDGVHSISFTGTTTAGDTSGASCVFYVDNTAPAILVSSPETGSTFNASTGSITFTGVTEPDALLSVYDVTTGSTLTPTAASIDSVTGEFTVTVTLTGDISSHQVTLIAADDLGNRSEKSFMFRSSLLSSITSLHLYEGSSDMTEQKLTAGEHTLKLVGKTSDGQTVEMNDPSLIEWDAQTLEGPALSVSLSDDGTRFQITAAENSVGVITGQLLVNDAGSYPVSCMVGSTLSVSTNEITVEVGESSPVCVSSNTGATLSFVSADTSVATVAMEDDGIAIVTGVKSGSTTVTVTASNGETATVEINVTGEELAEPTFGLHKMNLAGKIGIQFQIKLPDNFDTTGCYMSFSASDGTSAAMQFSDAEKESDTSYYFSCYVNALELADTITPTFHYDGDKTVTGDGYRAVDYFTSAHTVYGSNDKMIALIDALQNYGHYLQATGWTDGASHAAISATAELSAADITAATTGVAGYGVTKTLGDGMDAKIALVLNAQTVLRVYVKPKDGVTVTTPYAFTADMEGGTYYVYETAPIGPLHLGSDQTVTVETSDGTATVTASAMSYVKAMLEWASATEAQKMAMTAYYNYYQAALAYSN